MRIRNVALIVFVIAWLIGCNSLVRLDKPATKIASDAAPSAHEAIEHIIAGFQELDAALVTGGTPAPTPIVTLTPIPTPTGDLIPAASPWLSIKRPANPAEWRITSITYLDPEDAKGDHNIYVTVLNRDGSPASGVRVWQQWPGPPGDDRAFEVTKAGQCNFGMYGDSGFFPDRGERGPYWVYVGSESNSEALYGLGLPVRQHVVYLVTFRRQ